jgi:hypothetical protein
MDLGVVGCENGEWVEPVQDRVQWQEFVLAVLNFRVILPQLKLAEP